VAVVQGRQPVAPPAGLYADGSLAVCLCCRFPEGEWQSYKDDNLWRETSAEKRELQRLQADMINDVRQAAEVHRQVSLVMACWLRWLQAGARLSVDTTMCPLLPAAVAEPWFGSTSSVKCSYEAGAAAAAGRHDQRCAPGSRSAPAGARYVGSFLNQQLSSTGLAAAAAGRHDERCAPGSRCHV
jgi:hypothetical protein